MTENRIYAVFGVEPDADYYLERELVETFSTMEEAEDYIKDNDNEMVDYFIEALQGELDYEKRCKILLASKKFKKKEIEQILEKSYEKISFYGI